jgi:hypothetical protein
MFLEGRCDAREVLDARDQRWIACVAKPAIDALKMFGKSHVVSAEYGEVGQRLVQSAEGDGVSSGFVRFEQPAQLLFGARDVAERRFRATPLDEQA